MHTENLQLMSTMLGEVIAGTWKATQCAGINKIAREEVGKYATKKIVFSLNSWVELETSRKGHCGFSACAVGHAMLDRRFFDAGLRGVSGPTGEQLLPRLEGHGNRFYAAWEEVAEFFGLSHAQASTLFSPGYYPTRFGVSAKQVKARVDAMLAGNLDAHIQQGG